jgi:hypothetical protein
MVSAGSFFTSGIPHLEQSPGLSLSISGCIVQEYCSLPVDFTSTPELEGVEFLQEMKSIELDKARKRIKIFFFILKGF